MYVAFCISITRSQGCDARSMSSLWKVAQISIHAPTKVRLDSLGWSSAVGISNPRTHKGATPVVIIFANLNPRNIYNVECPKLNKRTWDYIEFNLTSTPIPRYNYNVEWEKHNACLREKKQEEWYYIRLWIGQLLWDKGKQQSHRSPYLHPGNWIRIQERWFHLNGYWWTHLTLTEVNRCLKQNVCITVQLISSMHWVKKLGIVTDPETMFSWSIQTNPFHCLLFLILEDNNPLIRFPKWAQASWPRIFHPSSSDLFASITEEDERTFLSLTRIAVRNKEYWAYMTLLMISSYSKA